MYSLCQLCAVEDTLSLFWCGSPSEGRRSSLLPFGLKENRRSLPFFFSILAHCGGVATVRRACNLSLTWRRAQRCSWYCERLCWALLLAEWCVFYCVFILWWGCVVMYKFPFYFSFTSFTLYINTVQILTAPVTVTSVISFEMFRHFFPPTIWKKSMGETDTECDSEHCYAVCCVAEEGQYQVN